MGKIVIAIPNFHWTSTTKSEAWEFLRQHIPRICRKSQFKKLSECESSRRALNIKAWIKTSKLRPFFYSREFLKSVWNSNIDIRNNNRIRKSVKCSEMCIVINWHHCSLSRLYRKSCGQQRNEAWIFKVEDFGSKWPY